MPGNTATRRSHRDMHYRAASIGTLWRGVTRHPHIFQHIIVFFSHSSKMVQTVVLNHKMNQKSTANRQLK